MILPHPDLAACIMCRAKQFSSEIYYTYLVVRPEAKLVLRFSHIVVVWDVRHYAAGPRFPCIVNEQILIYETRDVYLPLSLKSGTKSLVMSICIPSININAEYLKHVINGLRTDCKKKDI